MISLFWVVALCAAATAFVLRRRGHRAPTLSCSATSASWCGRVLTAGAMLLLAWWFVLHETVAEFPDGLASMRPPPIRWANTGPLRLDAGDVFPGINAEGWINVLPPGIPFAGKVVVINIFDDH